MPGELSGLRDKLYWRQVGDAFHCFKKMAESKGGKAARCISLCKRFMIQRSGGQACARPEPVLRCGRCDGLEANRRGWDESGPTLVPRLSDERFR